MARALFTIVLFTSIARSEDLTFQRAIQLALTHSPAIGMAAADQMKAQEAYRESFNQYKPNLTLGSGVGYSYGYPLSIEGSAPSIFNVNYTSTLYSPALKEFLKSTKLQWNAASKNADDQRKDVILDTAVTYIQLDRLTAELRQLANQQTESNNLVNIVSQRVQQGVDSQVELTRAKLVSARVQMQMAQLEGNADVLRMKLAQLTGLPPDSIATDTESVPKLPEVNQHSDMAAEALANSTAVKVANERAQAESFRAKGEWKSTYYPTFDLAAQYGLFSNQLNNYQDFFKKFQRNNASFGVVIRLPVFNFVQRAKADEAAADALKAKKQAEAVKNQVSSETLKLQRAIRQLSAAEQVAQLEYQLAQAEAQATQIRAQQATGPQGGEGRQPAAAAVSARDVANAQLQVGDKYSQFVDASFELDKARLQLLRATGELEKWALGK
ncbi:MAG: TolC family protein [Terriglobales bacterium]